jgi:archaellum component FlaF (FlaF/FlaG flagellin family)
MGVSPVLASIIMISVTIAGGMAIWSYVNTTSADVTEAYGEDVTSNINSFNEDFVITYVGLNATTDTISIWMYNNGQMDTEIKQILIWTQTNSTATSITTALTLTKGEVGNVTISQTVNSDETYYVKAVAQYASTYTTYQKAS